MCRLPHKDATGMATSGVMKQFVLVKGTFISTVKWYFYVGCMWDFLCFCSHPHLLQNCSFLHSCSDIVNTKGRCLVWVMIALIKWAGWAELSCSIVLLAHLSRLFITLYVFLCTTFRSLQILQLYQSPLQKASSPPAYITKVSPSYKITWY